MKETNKKRIHKAALTPRALFDFLVNGLTDIAMGRRPVLDENVRFQLYDYDGDEGFAMGCIQATDEEFHAIMLLSDKLKETNRGAFPCHCDKVVLSFGRNRDGKEYVSIRSKTSDNVVVKPDGYFFAARGQSDWKNFMYYGDGVLFCKNEMHQNGKLWPCTMKDLFESRLLSQRYVCLLIMEFFAQEHLLWGDLAKDLLAGSAYSSIPLPEIWAAHSRRELLENHYGVSMKRNNNETIGQGIFLIQARKVVKANELQKLYGFQPGRVYIGRKKTDLVHPLAEYIMRTCPDVKKPINLPHGFSTTISENMVADAINMEIMLRRKIGVTFHSPRGVLDWHDEASRIFRSRKMNTVKIPKNSRFKKLRMPPNCVRLTTRRQFLEEGDFQHNCVASYVDKVNADICSIWSMRKEDGTRNTIEICCRKSKENPDGYFYIEQMTAYRNSTPLQEDYNLVREAIVGQTPFYLKNR